MKFMEETEAVWSKEQLAAAEAEIEQQKKEWEAGRLAALRGETEEAEGTDAETSLTYSGVDARNQVTKTNRHLGSKNSTSGGSVSGGEEGTPRTRSHGRVSIDLWTLDDSPQPGARSTPSHTPGQRRLRGGKRKCSSPSSATPPPLTPYSNPNLVIRTRRASSSNSSTSDTNHLGNKVARLGRPKRRSEGSLLVGPVNSSS